MNRRSAKFARSIRPIDRRAFTLVEVVLVIAIIGIISVIAVPRLNSMSQSAQRSYLLGTVAAMEHYRAEHDRYPGYLASNGAPNNAAFVRQLLLYSDESGAANETSVGSFIYGPYLKSPFPRNPFNDLDNVHVKARPSDASPSKNASGWIAVLSTGEFGINADEADVKKVMRDVQDDVDKVIGRVSGS